MILDKLFHEIHSQLLWADHGSVTKQIFSHFHCTVGSEKCAQYSKQPSSITKTFEQPNNKKNESSAIECPVS